LQAQLARHTAALALAKIAAIELPLKQWPTLITTLLGNMGQQPPNQALKQATLESLGYICEEMGRLPQDVLEQGQVNSILTAVHQGMHKDEPDRDVRRAATTAMYNALEFAQTNFENQAERDVLMMAIFEGTTSPDEVIRQESFQCLVKVASGYYDKLPTYMQTIFDLTRRAVVEDSDDVAKQAIEFWCTVAEEEIDLQEVWCNCPLWLCFWRSGEGIILSTGIVCATE
jgi:importin subunit beta-1